VLDSGGTLGADTVSNTGVLSIGRDIASGCASGEFLLDDLRIYAGAIALQGEALSGLSCRYTYGLDLISQSLCYSTEPDTYYYGYDGQGSVRYLTDESGAVTDTYTYDAFGIQIASTGAGTPNNYRYSGEQWDQDLGAYYLRARYYKPDTGRFWTMDTFEGYPTDPASLHKYLYCQGNPINRLDPSGNMDLSIGSLLSANAIRAGLYGAALGGIRGAYFQFRHNGNRMGWNMLGQAALQGGIGFVGGVALANVPFAFWSTPVGAGGIALTSAASLKRAVEYAQNGDWDLAFVEAASAGAPLVFRNVVARGATVENIRATRTISGKKNIAFAEYEINGARGDRWAVSGEKPRGDSVAPVQNPQFSSERPYDTEKLIIEDIVASVIGGGNATGTLRIHTERPACEACQGVISEFSSRYPGIKVTVTNDPW
jgi:RHS repeat-associated protein